MRVLIVGAGLAGYTAAHHLLNSRAEITMIDSEKNVSSSVAAGIINPIVFRRTTLSWRLAELLEYGYPFYQNLEQKLNASFFRKIPIRRLFSHEQEREAWEKKQTQEAYQPYLKVLSHEDLEFPIEQNTFGTGVVLQAATVDSKAFLEANKRFFEERGMLQTAVFDYSELDPVKAKYNGKTYDYILFCEGKDGKYNPYFSYLPLTQTKGEVLTIQLQDLPRDESLNRKCFLMPQPDGTWKTGSNYVWDTDDSTPTEDAKAEILRNLESITSEKPEIVFHEAGVRPTVDDRRPLLGTHPEFPKLAIANGLGAKGFMTAPLVIKELIDHLLSDSALHPETTIQRFSGK
jgi:glycine/D-amino acid oxidase-like deaminating enzyme